MDIKTEGDISAKTCITVNEHDEMMGIEDIAKCHTFPTIRHRAFSLFMFHDDKVLMQNDPRPSIRFQSRGPIRFARTRAMKMYPWKNGLSVAFKMSWDLILM